MTEIENTRQMDLNDYLGILRRRKWWIIVSVILGPAIGYAVARSLPSRYTSQTLVLVEGQKVPDSFVKPVVTGVLDERLATMQEQILSRTRLEPIVNQFGLYGDQSKLSIEDKVALMRKAIEVTPIRPGGNRESMSGFYVSFTAPNARLAQEVCGQLTSLFMSENLKVREERSQGTTDFIATQLADAKRSLDEQDAKLADFQRQYMGQLPGDDQTNFNMLATLNSELDAATQALNQLQQNRTYTDSLLSAQLQSLQNLQAGGVTAASPDALQQQLAKDQVELSDLLSKYTETHPDVVRLKNDIAHIKQQIEARNAEPKPVTIQEHRGPEPVQIQQLRAQLASTDQAIRDKQKSQAKIQQEIEKYRARIELSPSVEAQYKALTRDHEAALKFYNDLLSKRNESEMATDLERRQEGEQFRVLDPPNLPDKPTFPDRKKFVGGGLAGGLALGLGIALLLELLNKVIRTEKDVLFYLQLPVLAAVPDLETVASRQFGRFRQGKQKAGPEAA
jgi:polysaccharide chain length determinant protein (PEP-CTERM system associated)